MTAVDHARAIVSPSTAPRVPLSILELAPVASGSSASQAVRAALDVAVVADEAGYHRIWFAEHHTTPGVVSTSPAVLAALAAERTRRIRVGSGAVLLAHTPPALAVEQFATLARVHPGRVDLGLGRAGIPTTGANPGRRQRAADAADGQRQDVPRDVVVDGLLVPAPPPFSLDDPAVLTRYASRARAVGLRADIPDYRTELQAVLGLLDGGLATQDGQQIRSGVAAGADLDVFALASSGGESARVAGELGLPLGANYHVSPATVLETVASYRSAFRPGVLAEPYVIVSADVLVAPTQAEAEEAAAGFDEWVLGIRSLEGAIPYPTPAQAAVRSWTDRERALVADRSRTRFVGDGERVVAGLAALVRATGADELLIATIAHDPRVRADSFRLLARAWSAS